MRRSQREQLLLASFAVAAGIALVLGIAFARSASTPQESAQPALPIRAAFYYPWYPEAWSQRGFTRYSRYVPSLGFYRSSDAAVIQKHIRAMDYGAIEAGISSWWGPGSKEDTRFPQLLSETESLNSKLRWVPYYEEEGIGDPAPAKIQGDLTYIKSRYASRPGYLRVGGRPVLFVSAGAADRCQMADRWAQGNAGQGFYLVLKAFPGSGGCASRPDSWHQHAPSKATERQAGHSYSISPGFHRREELRCASRATTPASSRTSATWSPRTSPGSS